MALGRGIGSPAGASCSAAARTSSAERADQAERAGDRHDGVLRRAGGQDDALGRADRDVVARARRRAAPGRRPPRGRAGQDAPAASSTTTARTSADSSWT